MKEFNLLLLLSSFKSWPSNIASVLPCVLANAGFMYTGYDDKVTCPVCRVEVQGWSDPRLSHPKDEHRRRSPQCAVVLNYTQADSSDRKRDEVGTRSSNNSRNTGNGSGPKAAASRSSVSTDRPDSSPGSSHHVVTLTEGIAVPTVPNTTRSIDRNNPDPDRLRDERARLGTFHDWPTTACVKPTDLAADGWYYTGQQDRVCCAFCRGVLHNWNRDDVPSVEHQKHFKLCPFVRGLDVGNVPMTTQTDAAAAAAAGARLGAIPKSTQHQRDASGSAKCSDMRSKSVTSDESVRPNVGAKSSIDAAARTTDNGTSQLSNENTKTAVDKVGCDITSNDDEEQRLLDEYRRLMEAKTCKVCMDKEINTIFLPCGHFATCNGCASKLRDCPVCRTYIRGTVKTILSQDMGSVALLQS